MTRATNFETWKANFGYDVEDANDYYAVMNIGGNIPIDINFFESNFANGFKVA